MVPDTTRVQCPSYMHIDNDEFQSVADSKETFESAFFLKLERGKREVNKKLLNNIM